MFVYRVEFGLSYIECRDEWASSVGPYRNYCTSDTAIWLDQFNKSVEVWTASDVDKKRHPAPAKDERLVRNLESTGLQSPLCKGKHFGFASLQKLSKWFNKYERETLHNAGYIVMVYETNEIYAGRRQCVFVKDNATPIRFIQLSEIY